MINLKLILSIKEGKNKIRKKEKITYEILKIITKNSWLKFSVITKKNIKNIMLKLNEFF